jgi:FkbM family methyltransferase
MTEAILSHLDPGDIFIDLGANEGFFSVLASKKVSYTGRVLSIELQERLWPVLVKNFAQNDCTNCHLVPFAIGNETGEIEVTLSPSLNSGQSSIIEGQSFLGSREIAKKIRSLYWKTQKVRVKKLDDIWQMYDLSQVKLIKIDIEGYEFEALRSARKVLEARKIKHILIEFHPVQLSQLNQSKEQIITYLSELGYRQSTQTGDLFSLVNGEA